MEAAVAIVWDQSERAVRAVVERIPDGTYTAESFLDNDGRNLDKPLRVKVTVKVEGSRFTVDFSEMNPQVPSPPNSRPVAAIAAARVAFKALPRRPRRQRGLLQAGWRWSCRKGDADARAPGGARPVVDRAATVIDTILKALAPAIPERVPAAHKGDMGGCSFFGFAPDGSRFLLMNIFGGGWGGRPHEDGESAAVSVCQGECGTPRSSCRRSSTPSSSSGTR